MYTDPERTNQAINNHRKGYVIPTPTEEAMCKSYWCFICVLLFTKMFLFRSAGCNKTGV